MIAVRGASGLGDSVYLRPIIEHFVRAGRDPVALSNYPEVFDGAGCRVEPFRRERVDVVAHYVTGKSRQGTTQFQDMAIAAGITEPVTFGFQWPVKNPALIGSVRERAAGRPVVIVHGGRRPMARTDGFGMELLPEPGAFEAALAGLEGCYLIGIGRDEPLYPLEVDEDLKGETTVSDLLDLFATCDGVLAQCSFAVPMAEVFDRPLLVLWAARGLAVTNLYIRQITPAKVLSKPTSTHVVDDWDHDRIRAAVRGFLRVGERAAA